MKKVHTEVHSKLHQILGKRHSKVSIYIPKKRNNKGKLVPTIDKQWHIYCYFRNPKTGKLNYKYSLKAGINRFKTVKERQKQATLAKKALEQLIDEGFSPFDKFKETSLSDERYISAENAILKAFEIKKHQWSENTLSSFESHIKIFIEYLRKKNINELNVTELKKKHIASFLNDLKVANRSNKTINNYRATLSMLFAQLVNDDILDYNFVGSIPVLKVKANKNKPYTAKQIKEIREFLIKTDPYLLSYLQFITYTFLRPIEVNRLKVGNIDVENNRIYTGKTKTNTHETILIITKLKEVIKNLDIEKSNKEYYIFTKFQKPYTWITKNEKQRQEWFMKRFRKVKKHFNLGDEYSIYSFRHSFALNLYHKFISDGLTDLEAKHKLMTITRHRSLSGLENYLRDIGAFVPDDYSEDYTIEF